MWFFCTAITLRWNCIGYLLFRQAFDSIAGNTVVSYRSLKKFLNDHKLMTIVIYN